MQKKKVMAVPQTYTQTSTAFIVVDEQRSHGKKIEEEKADYKVVRVAFDSEREDAIRSQYYEMANRNIFMADYRVLLSSKKFADELNKAYQNAYGKKIPDYKLSSKIVVATSDKHRENSRFIAITVSSANPEETKQITDLVLEQFSLQTQDLFGFNNIRIMDRGTPVQASPGKVSLKIVIALGVLAAILSWIIAFLYLLRKSPILNEDDLKFAIGTPALITVLRKKKAVVPASMELCCRMLLKDDSANQVIVAAPATEAENDPELACAMATGFSALGQKTLLIDFVKSNGAAGISDFLDGKNGFEEILEKSDDSYDCISRGATAVTTAQLNSNVFKDLVADLRLRYQAILIAVPAVVDSPMVSLLDDVTDSVVLTVQTGITGEQKLILAANQLKNCKIKSFHTVLFS